MKVAKKVTIVSVEAECECGGCLVAENGSFSLSVHEAGIRCQDCGAPHRLPKWVDARNKKNTQ